MVVEWKIQIQSDQNTLKFFLLGCYDRKILDYHYLCNTNFDSFYDTKWVDFSYASIFVPIWFTDVFLKNILPIYIYSYINKWWNITLNFKIPSNQINWINDAGQN